MSGRKIIIVLQVVLLAVAVFQVRVLANCERPYCNPWTEECNDPGWGQNCHDHRQYDGPAPYWQDWCCCIQPGWGCCQFYCSFWRCYSNPHGSSENQCQHDRVEREYNYLYENNTCGQGVTNCQDP